MIAAGAGILIGYLPVLISPAFLPYLPLVSGTAALLPSAFRYGKGYLKEFPTQHRNGIHSIHSSATAADIERELLGLPIHRKTTEILFKEIDSLDDQCKSDFGKALAKYIDYHWDDAVADESPHRKAYRSVRQASLCLTARPYWSKEKKILPDASRDALTRRCEGAIFNSEIRMAPVVESLLVSLSQSNGKLAEDYLENAIRHPEWRRFELQQNVIYSGGLAGLRESHLRHHQDTNGIHREFAHDEPRKLQYLISRPRWRYNEEDERLLESLYENLRSRPLVLRDAQRLISGHSKLSSSRSDHRNPEI